MTPFDAPMREALALAEQAIGLSDPNPRVGCVILGADGQVIGRGHTQQAGGPHAEVMALRDARARGAELRGSTAVVTLEPCAHHGRTPPCCDALIEAQVGQVVVALQDPFPLVAGQGMSRLRAAGIVVRDTSPELAEQARELNIGFLSRVQRGRPWVRLKAAVSLDGRSALANGTSQWITGPEARRDGHAWRKRAGAVLTGAGTVRDDNPRLDVREVATVRQPLRVVLDPRLETAPTARLLEPPGQVLLCALGDPDAASPAVRARQETLLSRGAELLWLPGETAADGHGRIDLARLLAELGQRGINELHVEAGERLNGALVQAGLVDEYLVYLAPKLLGPGRGLAGFGPLQTLSQAPSLRFIDCTPVGADLRLRARPLGGAANTLADADVTA